MFDFSEVPLPTFPRTVSILGSAGSIGQNAVAVLEQYRELFRVKALTTFSQVDTLVAQAKALHPEYVVIGDEAKLPEVKEQLEGCSVCVLAGQAALLDIAAFETDVTLVAISGIAGLEPTWRALEGARILAIANKESIVASGGLLQAEAKRRDVQIIPVDSEHSALFQLLSHQPRQQVKKLIVTASGGPFRGWTAEALGAVTISQALQHPNWRMGRKNTIDSATLVNKGLEVIEAAYLFDMPADRLDAWVHPESVVHGILEMEDSSFFMQASYPDMKNPIAYGLSWPRRLSGFVAPLCVGNPFSLTFEPVDHKNFRAVRVARRCLEEGPWATLTFNRANEEAVTAFLEGRISFLQIMVVVEETLAHIKCGRLESLQDILSCDKDVKVLAQEILRKMHVKRGA